MLHRLSIKDTLSIFKKIKDPACEGAGILYDAEKPYHYGLTVQNGETIQSIAIIKSSHDKICKLIYIYTFPEYRNKGYGTTLLKYLQTEYSCIYLNKWTTELHSILMKLNFCAPISRYIKVKRIESDFTSKEGLVRGVLDLSILPDRSLVIFAENYEEENTNRKIWYILLKRLHWFAPDMTD